MSIERSFRAEAADLGPASPGLGEYFAVLWRRRMLLLVPVVVALVAALVYVAVRDPSYEARASVLLNPAALSSASGGRQAVDMDTERLVASSHQVAALAAEALGRPDEANRVLRSYSVTPSGDSTVLRVTFSASNRRDAQAGAQAVAEAILAVRAERQQAEADAEDEVLRRQIAELEAEAAGVQEALRAAEQGTAEFVTAQSRYSALASRIVLLRSQIVDLSEEELRPGRIITPARLPAERSFVKDAAPALGIALAIGLLIGIIAAFVRDRFDDRLRSPRDIERTLQIPVTATIVRSRRSRSGDPGLVMVDDPTSAPAEAFRRARSRLITHASGTTGFVIVMAAPTRADGSHSVPANLAVALTGANQQVLLISADLRLPRAQDVLGASGEAGLSDALQGRAPLDNCLVPSSVPGLTVLPGGSLVAAPGDLIASEAMRKLLVDVRDEFDFVVLDAPPVLEVADTLALAPHADEVLLVAKLQVTREESLLLAAQQLDEVGARLSGVVAWNAPASTVDMSRRFAYRANPSL